MEEAHEKALNLIDISNAIERDSKSKAKNPTNTIVEKKKAPDQATITKNRNPGGNLVSHVTLKQET